MICVCHRCGVDLQLMNCAACGGECQQSRCPDCKGKHYCHPCLAAHRREDLCRPKGQLSLRQQAA